MYFFKRFDFGCSKPHPHLEKKLLSERFPLWRKFFSRACEKFIFPAIQKRLCKCVAGSLSNTRRTRVRTRISTWWIPPRPPPLARLTCRCLKERNLFIFNPPILRFQTNSESGSYHFKNPDAEPDPTLLKNWIRNQTSGRPASSQTFPEKNKDKLSICCNFLGYIFH